MKPTSKKPVAAKSKKIKVNFEGVETRVLVPEGNYHAKVFCPPTLEDGQQYPYLKWTFALIDDNEKINNQKAYTNTSMAPQSLWNLRNLLETLGVETPDSEMELAPEDYVDLELMIRIEHETYEGKDRAKVTDFSMLEETTETEDDTTAETEEEVEEEEEPAPPPKKKPAAAPAKPTGKPAPKKPAPSVVEEEEEVEEEVAEEEEEAPADEEEEAPAEDEEEAPALTTAAEITEMDDTELAALVKLHELPLKLKTIPKRSKRIAAVIDAMEKADLLGE